MLRSVLAIALAASASAATADFPTALADILAAAARDPAAFADEVSRLPSAAVVAPAPAGTAAAGTAAAVTYPTLLAHGMGDSCFNAGFESLVADVANYTQQYAVCVPTGRGRVADTVNGFLLSLDASVDVFAEGVRADPELAGGFNAIGLSQGNALLRGYIAKYNDPPVKSWLSVCGVNAGVAAFPDCPPSAPGKAGSLCERFASLLGKLAYNEHVQEHLFQAGYYRAPDRLDDPVYKANSMLARYNGEADAGPVPSDMRAAWLATSKYVWIEGTLDTVVWPRGGEQWGALGTGTDDPYTAAVVPMNETAWFIEDLFGLKEADEAGKNFFESFRGEHIAFTRPELYGWIDRYFE